MNSLQPILLIEDDDVDVMTIKRCFKELKISNELIIAVNGQVALDLLLSSHQALRPSLVLLDINMPVMNGLDFLEKFKTHDRLKSIPVVIFTSSKEEKDILNCYQLGVAGYMVKSVEYEQNVEAIDLLNSYWSINELPL